MKYQRIVDLREDRDLKQSVIADLLGTSQTQYSRGKEGRENYHYIMQ